MKVRKKASVVGGVSESSREKKLKKLEDKWKANGWDIVEVFNGGLNQSSYIIVEGDSYLKDGSFLCELVKADQSVKNARDQDSKLQNILNQIQELGETDTFGTKKEVKFLPEILDDAESVLGLTSGVMDGTTWLIVCTPKRVILLDKGMIYGLKQKEFLLKAISSVEFNQGLFLGEIKITASSSTMKIENVAKASVKKFVETVNSAREKLGSKEEIKNPEPPQEQSLVDKLKELSQMKDSGILSEDEFLKAKEKLLT